MQELNMYRTPIVTNMTNAVCSSTRGCVGKTQDYGVYGLTRTKTVIADDLVTCKASKAKAPIPSQPKVYGDMAASSFWSKSQFK